MQAHCALPEIIRRNVMTSFISSNKKLARAGITAAVALYTTLFTYGASAEQISVRSLTVSFADLDLSRAAGAQALYKRIKFAARRVCGSQGNYASLAAQSAWRKCYDTAVANAVAEVDRPSLTALYKQKSDRAASG
jgi:UrcA family protein